MAISFDYYNSTLNKKLGSMEQKVASAILMYCATKAQTIESDMKQNRPWTDRTGMAKATLSAKVSQPDPQTVRITLAHGVEYGMWLELAHEKNYAIVAPSVNKFAPVVINDLNNIFSKINV